MILSDTNILSTFAKIEKLSLLIDLFSEEQIGVVPAVFEELQNGVSRGYAVLEDALEFIQQSRIGIVVPSPEEILKKGALPRTFDEGERETIAVAGSRGCKVLTNETLVKNWCQKVVIEYWDLPAILRALWRANLLTKDQVRTLIEQIEEKDRVVFKYKERIFED